LIKETTFPERESPKETDGDGLTTTVCVAILEPPLVETVKVIV